MELPYCAVVDVTIQLDDTLCREARHQAVDAELSLSGWIAQLVRERIARVGGSCGRARTLLDMLGDENADGADFEIPAFPEVVHPAELESGSRESFFSSYPLAFLAPWREKNFPIRRNGSRNLLMQAERC